MDIRRLRQFVKDHGVPRMLRHLGVAPAASSRFLLGQQLTLMRSVGVDCVLDVGANVGQYARELRAAGYTAAIHSFEPGPDAYRRLAEAAVGDPRWATYPFGFGLEEMTAELRTWKGTGSENATLRTPVPGVATHFGESDTHPVRITTVAAWLEEHPECVPARTLLKLDVQGYEREVLQGAGEALSGFALAEVEAPLTPWYEGQASLSELMGTFEAAGFRAASIVTERFHNEWLGAADVDVLFIQSALSRVPR